MSDLPATSNTALVSFIERAARDETFDVGKFEALLRMQKEIEHDQARKAFNRAMAEAQAEMLPIMRESKNSHLGNRYAKLEAIDAVIRPVYTRHGFSVRYGSAPAPHEGMMRITCTVAHDSGYFEENYLDGPVSTAGSQGGRMAITPVQAIGSTVTYLRRYLLGMVWNAVLADDDDDGEASRRAAATAMPRAPRVAEKTPTTPQASWLSPLEETDPHRWELALDTVLATCQSRAEVEQVGAHHSVGTAIVKAPNGVRERVSKKLATAYGRFTDDAEAEAELPEIVGEDRVGAG